MAWISPGSTMVNISRLDSVAPPLLNIRPILSCIAIACAGAAVGISTLQVSLSRASSRDLTELPWQRLSARSPNV